MNKFPAPRKCKPRPETKSKMPCEQEKPAERHQPSYSNQPKNPKGSMYQSTISEMQNSWQSDIHEQRSSKNPSNSMLEDCFGFKIMPSSMWADCMANLPFCDQNSSYEQRQGIFQYSSYK
jgi:hypothetical protein